MAREKCRDGRPLASCWRMRTASVFTPRRTRQHSNGDRIPPVHFWTKCERLRLFGPRRHQHAANPSEWPFRNFVVECITMSAPSSIGR